MGPSMVPAMVPAAMAAQLAALPGYTYAPGSNAVTFDVCTPGSAYATITVLALYTYLPLPCCPTSYTTFAPYTLHFTFSRSGLGDMSPQFAMVPMTGGSLPGVPSPSRA